MQPHPQTPAPLAYWKDCRIHMLNGIFCVAAASSTMEQVYTCKKEVRLLRRTTHSISKLIIVGIYFTALKRIAAFSMSSDARALSATFEGSGI